MKHAGKSKTRKNRNAAARPLALDPFLVFTSSLLVLAGGIQIFLVIWMDLF